MTPPLVSVLIPAYNAAPFLGATLDTVLAQDCPDMEVVVVDDGSTDDTAAVLAAVDDPRLRVIHQDNTGLVGALNRGLDEVRGRFVARMDADDPMPPGRLSAQLRAMTADPRLVVCGTDYELFGAVQGRVRMPRSDAACRQRLAFGSCHCGASVMIRGDVLARSGLRFRDEFAHAEDYRMWVELAEYGRLGNLPMIGYLYRIHDGQVSALHRFAQRDAHLRIAREYAAAAGLRPLSDAALGDLLWPDVPAGPLPLALARQLGAVAGPAATAVSRRLGVESARFVGRKVYEALASVRSR